MTNGTLHLWVTRHFSVASSGKRELTGSLKDGTSKEKNQTGKAAIMISTFQHEVKIKKYQTSNLNLVDVIENLKTLILKV